MALDQYDFSSRRFTAWRSSGVASNTARAACDAFTRFISHLITTSEIDDLATQPVCLLDYLYLWLVRGDAAEYCPSFEDWLVTTINCIQVMQEENLLYNFYDPTVEVVPVVNRGKRGAQVSVEEVHPALIPSVYRYEFNLYQSELLVANSRK